MSDAATSPLVVLTRPEGRNEGLAARLRDSGFWVLEMPALEIFPLPIDLTQCPLPHACELIIFVSANAARLYLQHVVLHSDGRVAWPATTLAATVGEASAKPLREAGFIPDSCIVHPPREASQDSEALLRVLQATGRTFRHVLVVCGESGRTWLGERLQEQGAIVRRCPVYGRRAAGWTADQREGLAVGLRSQRVLVGLFTSSEGVEAFHRNLVAAALQIFWRRARFVAIHERVANRLRFFAEADSEPDFSSRVKICPPAEDAIFETVRRFASQ
jgi:uroporphyrinogen-III synthase